jgi:predicted sulfurtransferase
MNDLIRLVYISRSTEQNQAEHHVQAINEQILSKARTFNEANNITGVLCFAHACYFQLIEGPKHAVELLYAKIQKDPRHDDIKLMFIEPVASRAFSKWQMKFIEDINLAMPLVRMHGHKHFNPFEFAENLFKDLIDFLSQKCAECKV